MLRSRGHARRRLPALPLVIAAACLAAVAPSPASAQFAPGPAAVEPLSLPPLPRTERDDGPLSEANETTDDLETRIRGLEEQLRELRESLRQDDEDQPDEAAEQCPAPRLLEVGPPSALVPTVRWTGQLQLDSVHAHQDARNLTTVGPIPHGTGFRRARLGAFGDVYENIEYRIEMDFALSGRPSFLDVWLGVQELPGVGTVRVGHHFEPFSLERLTPNRFMTFMERSVADHFAPARNTGIKISDFSADRSVTWSYGLFRSASDEFGDDVAGHEGWAGTGRLTWAPGFDPDNRERLLHLGLGYSLRGADDHLVRFRERPEIRMQRDGVASVPFFVDTGLVPARFHQLLGAEVAIVRGPFSVQGEWMLVPVDRIGGPNPTFHAHYIYTSYFLTGEHRPYFRTRAPFRRITGVFDRVVPRTNVFKPHTVEEGNPPGIGAWEVAVRWSSIDLNSHDILGGRLSDVTFALNWYLNPYTRVQWNYIIALLDDPQTGRSQADIFGMRCGFDF